MENIDSSKLQSIKAEELNLEAIFTGKYLFEIPIYQRPYAWQEEQVLQLIDDLTTAAFEEDDDEPYFLGSLVIIKKDETFRSDVIDGQQRLTTLTILLAILRKIIIDEEIKGNLTDMIMQKGNRLKKISNEYRFKTRERDQDFFSTLIQEKNGLDNFEELSGTINSDSKQNIFDNAKLLLDTLTERNYGEEKLIQLAQFIILKCLFIVVTAFNKEKAFRIFKVLNGRGMPLSMADMFKAEFLENFDDDLEKEYGQKWEETEAYLGQENFEKLFSYIRAIKLKRIPRGTILEDITNNLKPHENPIDFIDNQLLVYAKSFSIIKNESFQCEKNKIREAINNELYWLNQLRHKGWLPPTILFIAKHEKSPTKVFEFLKQLNILTLGLGIHGTYSKDRISRFYSLIEEIESHDQLTGISSLYLKPREKKSIKIKIGSANFFNKNQKYAKALLLRIEERESGINEKHSYDSISIEHVLPQNPYKSSKWVKDFDLKKQKELTNQIGNLVLLSIQKNKKAANKEFNDKKKNYLGKGNTPPFKTTQGVLSESDWKPSNIINRTSKLKILAFEVLKLK